jgi:hypothetical protein
MTTEIHDINTRAVDFVVELIDYIAEYPDDDYMTMECLCRKLVKYGLIDKENGYYLVANGIKADRKTEPSNSEKPNNSTKATISKMEQVPSCIDCTHYGDYEVCKGCDDDYNKFKSYYEPKDEQQTERSE